MTPNDFASPTWRRFTHELKVRLQDLRERNDSLHISHEETAVIRGQIAEVKRLLALDPSSAREEELPDSGEF